MNNAGFAFFIMSCNWKMFSVSIIAYNYSFSKFKRTNYFAFIKLNYILIYYLIIYLFRIYRYRRIDVYDIYTNIWHEKCRSGITMQNCMCYYYNYIGAIVFIFYNCIRAYCLKHYKNDVHTFYINYKNEQLLNRCLNNSLQ